MIILIYFIADTHFGHENIIKMCNRPFNTIEEMNSEIICRWNSKISNNDTVYVLGDMFYRCNEPEEILKQLKGKKRLIEGNHDNSWLTQIDVLKYFKSIDKFAEVSDGKRSLTLCHYPLVTWKHSQKSYMIHGHIHNNTEADFWQIIKRNERILNAGVDINNFEPVSFDELFINNNKFKQDT